MNRQVCREDITNMEEIRIGIIGIGNMGTNHLKSILSGKVEHLRVTAIADRK